MTRIINIEDQGLPIIFDVTRAANSSHQIMFPPRCEKSMKLVSHASQAETYVRNIQLRSSGALYPWDHNMAAELALLKKRDEMHAYALVEEFVMGIGRQHLIRITGGERLTDVMWVQALFSYLGFGNPSPYEQYCLDCALPEIPRAHAVLAAKEISHSRTVVQLTNYLASGRDGVYTIFFQVS